MICPKLWFQETVGPGWCAPWGPSAPLTCVRKEAKVESPLGTLFPEDTAITLAQATICSHLEYRNASCLVSSASALAASAAAVIGIMGIMFLPCSEPSNGLWSHTESMSQTSRGLQGLPCGVCLPTALICCSLPSSPLATPASLPFLTPARYALTWGLCAPFSFCLEYSPSRDLCGFPNLILL